MHMPDSDFLREHIELIKNLSTGKARLELNKQKKELEDYLTTHPNMVDSKQDAYKKLKDYLKRG